MKQIVQIRSVYLKALQWEIYKRTLMDLWMLENKLI